MMTAPRAASSSATVDLPAPIPPVSPTRSNSAGLGRRRVVARCARVERLDVVRGHLGDVHEALDAVTDLDERAERHELGDLPVHELADLVAVRELLPRILLRCLE